jgi:hypothetical protein
MKTRSVAIALYRDWQDALSHYGVTHVATDLFFELCRHIEADPFLDAQGFEAALERLHDQAYPVASTRPARLHTGLPQDVLDDAPGFSHGDVKLTKRCGSITKQPLYLSNSNSGSDEGVSVPTKGR